MCVTLQEIHPIATVAPQNISTAQTVSAQKAPQHFTTLLGSILGAIPDEDESAQQPAPKKKDSDSAGLITPAPQTQIPQPVLLPLTLKMHLVLPSTAPSKSSKDEEDPAPSTNNQQQANLLQTLQTLPFTSPQAPNPAQPSHSQTGNSQLPLAETRTSGTRIDTPVEEPAPVRLAVSSEPSKSQSQFDSAFALKLTPVVASAGSEASAGQTPTRIATTAQPSKVVNSPDNTSVQDSSQNQQPDSDSDGTLTQEFKQPEKPAVKATQNSGPSDPEPASTNTSLPQLQITAPAPPPPEKASVISSMSDSPEPTPSAQTLDTRPAEAAIPARSSTSNSEPVRDLSLRLGNNPTNQVEVKIQERSGEVHVAVSSASPSLTTDLKQQVGDLIGKLDRTGYHAEALRQPGSTSSQQTSSQTGPGQQDLPERQQQERQQAQARPKRTTQPQWLSEMNNSFGPNSVEGIENS